MNISLMDFKFDERKILIDNNTPIVTAGEKTYIVYATVEIGSPACHILILPIASSSRLQSTTTTVVQQCIPNTSS